MIWKEDDWFWVNVEPFGLCIGIVEGIKKIGHGNSVIYYRSFAFGGRGIEWLDRLSWLFQVFLWIWRSITSIFIRVGILPKFDVKPYIACSWGCLFIDGSLFERTIFKIPKEVKAWLQEVRDYRLAVQCHGIPNVVRRNL